MAKENSKEKEFMPVRVSTFDKLITNGGIERGNTVLLSGGCGSGKTIFGVQSVYNAVLNNEKAVYITLEETAEKIKRHMKRNFGWDLDALEERGSLSMQYIDSVELAKDIEQTLDEGDLRDKSSIELILEKHPEISLIDSRRVGLPFKPDRIVVDSLTALSSSFSDLKKYRLYLQVMVDSLNKHDSVNILLGETDQDPVKYSSHGPEEFLVDGVVVLYNIRKGQLRRRAIEIVKMRCSDHVKELIPYTIDKSGFKIMPSDKLF
ncbi:MAG: ATPase domain-containing protein [Candidatus Altiarchaeota archaeon]